MGIELEKFFKTKRSKYSKVWYIFYMYMAPTGLIHDIINNFDSLHPVARDLAYLRFMSIFHEKECKKYGPTNVAGFLPNQSASAVLREESEEMNKTVRKCVIDFISSNLPSSIDPNSLEVVITPHPSEGYATATLEYERYDFYADYSTFLVY